MTPDEGWSKLPRPYVRPVVLKIFKTKLTRRFKPLVTKSYIKEKRLEIKQLDKTT